MNEYIQEKKWKEIWEENYPFMISLIERTLGELRTKDFIDCMDLIETTIQENAYNRGVEDSLKCVPEESTNKVKTKYDKNGEIVSYNFVNHSQNKGFDRCRQQTIDNISKLLTNK